MKTLTIKDEVYEKLLRLKRENESFSDVLERLISRERTSLRTFYGSLKDLSISEGDILTFRKRVSMRSVNS
jgi:predicted CopG family antitoxin